MVINETKEQFGIKLLDYYNSTLLGLKDLGDKESKQWAIDLLMPKYKQILEDIVVNHSQV